MSTFYWISALLTLFLAVNRSYAVPPEGLEHLVVPAKHDYGSLEITDFSAQLLTGNLRSLAENLRVLNKAVGHAAIATFEWSNDNAGRATALAAIRAARRGVRVVVLVDGLVLRNPERLRLMQAMRREGVEIYEFHPIFRSGLKAFKRMHEKAVYAIMPDGRVVMILGGRNKGDHYLVEEGTFDVDVRITIDRAQGEKLYIKQFDALLRSGATFKWDGYKGYSDLDHEKELLKMMEADDFIYDLIKTGLHRSASHPEVPVKWGLFVRNRGGKPTLTRTIEAAIAGAKKSVMLANAYFIPEPRLEKVLAQKLAEEVQIAAFTNSFQSTHHTNVVRLMETAVDTLMPAGLALFLRKEGELHAKTTKVDGRVLIVGAANLDGRSEHSDTQNGLVLDSRELAGQFDTEVSNQLVRGEYNHIDGRIPGFRPMDRCMRLLLGLGPIRKAF